MGPQAAERPPPSFGSGLAGAGGALVAGAVTAVALDRWDGGAGVPLVLTAAVLVASLAVLAGTRPAPLASAAVAASGLVVPAAAFFGVALVGGDDRFPSLRAVALVAGLLLAALYLVAPAPGHTFHLAVLAVAGWLLGIGLAGSSPAVSVYGFGTVASVLSGAGVASVLVGLTELGAGVWLDRTGLRAMATPLLGVGSLALGVGAAVAWRDSGDLAAALAVVVTGGVIAAAGRVCRRRGPLWAGLGLVGAGVVGLAVSVGPNGLAGRAGLVVAAGAGLVALGLVIAGADR